jgi:hypothetical protein
MQQTLLHAFLDCSRGSNESFGAYPLIFQRMRNANKLNAESVHFRSRKIGLP